MINDKPKYSESEFQKKYTTILTNIDNQLNEIEAFIDKKIWSEKDKEDFQYIILMDRQKLFDNKLYSDGPGKESKIMDRKKKSSSYNKGIPMLETEVLVKEPSGNQQLDTGETITLTIKIVNRGDGMASGMRAKVSAENVKGIDFKRIYTLNNIPPGGMGSFQVALKGSKKLPTQENAKIKISFEEALGFPPNSIELTLSTNALLPPQLVINTNKVDEISGNKNNAIEKGEKIQATLMIKNIGELIAENVQFNILIEDPNIIPLDIRRFPLKQSIKKVLPDEMYELTFLFAVNKNYQGATSLPIFLETRNDYQVQSTREPLNLILRPKNSGPKKITLDPKKKNQK